MNEPRRFKGMAIMLYVESQQSGSDFHAQYLAPFGLPRIRHPNAKFYTDYHVTIGYVHGVQDEDIEPFKEHFKSQLPNFIDPQSAVFNYAYLSLLGSSSRPFLVVMPFNTHTFKEFNEATFELLHKFEGNKYKMEPLMQPNRYLPHINIYGQLNKNISPADAPQFMSDLHNKLQGLKLPLPRLRVH